MTGIPDIGRFRIKREVVSVEDLLLAAFGAQSQVTALRFFAGEELVPWGTRGLVGQLLLLRTGGVKNHSLQYHAKQKTRLVSARIESGRKPASKSSRPVHR